MNILIIGSGGREHALAWKIAQSPRAAKVFVAPGNGGTAGEPRLINIPITDIPALTRFAQQEQIAFTIVGPEAALADGIVDAFRAQHLNIVGPTRAAAQLEWSKVFAKRFMQRHGIPTADYQIFSEAEQAHDYIQKRGVPIVIKADGLAAGKGVVVATSLEEAHAAIDYMLRDQAFGRAGQLIIVEDCLEGEELSFTAIVQGKHIVALASSQDHKRLYDGDRGPNTGGMGAYSPAPLLTSALHATVMRQIVVPTVFGMADEGRDYTGFLYVGLMIGPDETLKVLEFNCRLGDPETQAILPRLKSDFVAVLEQAFAGRLEQAQIEWDRRVALGVVLAAKHYPRAPQTGDVIHGLSTLPPDVHVFHAGSARRPDGQIVTNGGRVLCVTALGDGYHQAQARAYEAIVGIRFDNMQYRRDIGWRALLTA